MTSSATGDLETRLAYARDWTRGSAYYERMGIEVADLAGGRSTLRMTIAPHHLNADGIVHGGALPALADAAMGSAARTLNGAAAQLLTTESNIRYFRAVAGGTLTAEGRVVKAGRRIVFTEVDVTDAKGEAVARGGGSFLIQRRD